jgi:hypothetical protein
MLLPTLMLFQQATRPASFGVIVVGLLIAGGIGGLIAAVLGFARAPAFGPSARWFSYAAVCLVIYHLQFLLFGLLIFANATQGSDLSGALTFGAFFNLFIVLASICLIMGFVRLTRPR